MISEKIYPHVRFLTDPFQIFYFISKISQLFPPKFSKKVTKYAYQFDVVAEGAGVVHPVPFAAHHLEEVVEAGLVVVEDEDLLPGVDELLHDEVLAPPDELVLRVHDGLQEPQVLKHHREKG